MISILKKAFKITNNNLILTTPQVLFMILSGVFLKLSGMTDIKGLVLTFLIFVLMTGAFLAGWFAMVKDAILQENTEPDTSKTSYNLLKSFPQGVGEQFINYSVAILLFFILITFVLYGAYQSALHFIGILGITVSDINNAMVSTDALNKFLNSLTMEQLIKINQWNFMFLGFLSTYMFLIMLWAPEIAYEKSNAFKAFIMSIAKLFKNFFKSLTIFLFAMMLHIITSILTVFSGNNGGMYFVSTLLSIYTIAYIVVLLFLYYEREIKSNCDSRSDCERENEASN